ncbi:MAG: SsrA-binding protein SmpB [Kiritimatiellaeota bacterium]|nr:SsrA-binding protein SmpB [Kiritimatiellota bacterium]
MSPPSASNSGAGIKILTRNRKATHDYFVEERIECGLQLLGTEVKVVREGKAGLSGAFAHIDKRTNEAFLDNVSIPPYDFGNRFNHDSLRRRKLLLHRKQILRLREWTEQKGHTLVPLSMYLLKGRVKVELGVCKGKQDTDKRETIRRREDDIEAKRAISARWRGN